MNETGKGHPVFGPLIICISGPPGVGKTTLVEVLLRGLNVPSICVRTERDGALPFPQGSVPKDHPELSRYADAGALGAALYRFPGDQDGGRAFFEMHFLLDDLDAVFVEGPSPILFPDLAVFVAPPLPGGESLLVQVQKNNSKRRGKPLESWSRALESPQMLARFVERGLGAPLLEALLTPKPDSIENAAGSQAEATAPRGGSSRKAGAPWVLAPGYAGIEMAHLVVVNARRPEHRQRGDSLIAELADLRKKPDLFRKIAGPLGSRAAITAVVADLHNSGDAGVKKALARVRRKLQKAEKAREEGWG